jgi:8-oxo-dGTP pyrophosphatase MutT (NUDIX family)
MEFRSAKAILRLPSSQLYLVTKHQFGTDKYSLLGGTREDGETPNETLEREFFEETSGVLQIHPQTDETWVLTDGKKKWILNPPKVVHETEPYDVVFYLFDIYSYIEPEEFLLNVNQKIIQNQNVLLKSEGYNPSVIRTMSQLLEIPLNELLYKINPRNDNWVFIENDGLDFVPFSYLQNQLFEKNILKYI